MAPTSESHPLKYQRLLVKLSGEALMGTGAYGIDMAVVNRLARDVSIKASPESLTRSR